MATYKVINKQNLFDISIQLYGTIEGIYDLLISNPELSMSDELVYGQELEYHESFIINQSIVDYFIDKKITPVNGNRGVYHKQCDKELVCVIDYLSTENYAVLELSGDGDMIVDWGDNTKLETISLSQVLNRNVHYFDNTVDKRLIKLYGNFNIKELVGSEILGNIVLVKPMIVDEFKSYKNNLLLTSLFLFRNTYLIDLKMSKISDLLPIAGMNLQELDLRDCKMTQNCIDEYLKYVVANYGTRRNCLVRLTTVPSGSYSEPAKDANGNYIVKTGMEAVWVITHEFAWNEAGDWMFNINNTIYQYES